MVDEVHHRRDRQRERQARKDHPVCPLPNHLLCTRSEGRSTTVHQGKDGQQGYDGGLQTLQDSALTIYLLSRLDYLPESKIEVASHMGVMPLHCLFFKAIDALEQGEPDIHFPFLTSVNLCNVKRIKAVDQ
jgi:hypothetical protein